MSSHAGPLQWSGQQEDAACCAPGEPAADPSPGPPLTPFDFSTCARHRCVGAMLTSVQFQCYRIIFPRTNERDIAHVSGWKKTVQPLDASS